jgi:hypothetical protein
MLRTDFLKLHFNNSARYGLFWRRELFELLFCETKQGKFSSARKAVLAKKKHFNSIVVEV